MLLKSFNKKSFENSCGNFNNRFVCGMVAVIFLITGCTMVGPDFVKPEAPVETEWLESRDPEIKTAPMAAVNPAPIPMAKNSVAMD